MIELAFLYFYYHHEKNFYWVNAACTAWAPHIQSWPDPSHNGEISLDTIISWSKYSHSIVNLAPVDHQNPSWTTDTWVRTNYCCFKPMNFEWFVTQHPMVIADWWGPHVLRHWHQWYCYISVSGFLTHSSFLSGTAFARLCPGFPVVVAEPTLPPSDHNFFTFTFYDYPLPS